MLKIYKVIANHIPTHCIVCPISTLHICGKEVEDHPTSGSAVKIYIPDGRCKIRVGCR